MKFNRLVSISDIMYKSTIELNLMNCDFILVTKMSYWNLFKLLKRKTKFVKRPTISNPILICPNIERNFGDLNTNNKIIDVKSEKNLASLDEIKATLLQWKEENDKIFRDYENEQVFFSPKKVRNELCHSITFDSALSLNIWKNRHKVTTIINESESSDNEEREGNFPEVFHKRPILQDSIKRPERSNSFKALGKVLIKEEDKDQETDYF